MTRPLHNNSSSYVPKHAVTIAESGNCAKQEYGSIQIDFCDMLLRVHNDCRPGGVALVPLIANCEDAAGNPPVIPRQTVPVPVEVPAEGNTRINHNLGYYPIVQVMDASGQLINPSIVHEDENNFVINNTGTDPARVIYR